MHKTPNMIVYKKIYKNKLKIRNELNKFYFNVLINYIHFSALP